MNRQIKFRAWDEKFKSMIYMDTYHRFGICKDVAMCQGSDTLLVNPDNYPLMQYTELKDKNGKEIYEGDIVKLDWRNEFEEVVSTDILCVEFYMGYFQFNNSIPVSVHSPKTDGLPPCEIIGNIHENPELLTQ